MDLGIFSGEVRVRVGAAACEALKFGPKYVKEILGSSGMVKDSEKTCERWRSSKKVGRPILASCK